MRLFPNVKRLSPATIISFIALFISLGGIAVAASTLVNIVDPVTGSTAHVTSRGQLQVITEQGAPNSFYHSGVTTVSTTCKTLVTAPGWEDLVVKQVAVNAYGVPTPGSNANVFVLYAGTGCTGAELGETLVPDIGSYTIRFDPGLVVKRGTSVSAIGVQIGARVWMDGFYVISAVVVP
jgi:hypothetical protein